MFSICNSHSVTNKSKVVVLGVVTATSEVRKSYSMNFKKQILKLWQHICNCESLSVHRKNVRRWNEQRNSSRKKLLVEVLNQHLKAKSEH